jgi:hypothetical protein
MPTAPGTLAWTNEWEVRHEAQHRNRRPPLLSSTVASVVAATHRRPGSRRAGASSTAKRNCSRSWDETTPAPAARHDAFKDCCMKSGRFDGSERDYYFQGSITTSGPPTGGPLHIWESRGVSRTWCA